MVIHKYFTLCQNRIIQVILNILNFYRTVTHINMIFSLNLLFSLVFQISRRLLHFYI
jgi:hypothetical protein